MFNSVQSTPTKEKSADKKIHNSNRKNQGVTFLCKNQLCFREVVKNVEVDFGKKMVSS